MAVWKRRYIANAPTHRYQWGSFVLSCTLSCVPQLFLYFLVHIVHVAHLAHLSLAYLALPPIFYLQSSAVNNIVVPLTIVNECPG